MVVTCVKWLLLFVGLCWAAYMPMESITQYNVILVHGAASSTQGFDCGSNGYPYLDAFSLADKYAQGDTSEWSLGPATGMLGSYDNKQKITNWLNSVVFEHRSDDVSSPYIYLQRSFQNPANSPSVNAREIGDRLWKGEGRCKNRRSLFEEAQEVRAGGLDKLFEKRNDTNTASYRTLPSRNIIISHSMGGVVSREYVQGPFYQGDVDKVVTLDSPHEGTGSLNMLIDVFNIKERILQSASNTPLSVSMGILYLAFGKDPGSLGTGLIMTAPLYTGAINTGLSAGIVSSMKGFDYNKTDGLVDYIDPTNEERTGVLDLQDRVYTASLPMMRLLSGKNSMVFSDPNKGGGRQAARFFLPDALVAPVGNVVTHLTGNGSVTANFTNASTGFMIGLLGGITVQEHGTALIPEKSGYAQNTPALNDARADVRRVQYDAAFGANSSDIEAPLFFAASATFLLAIDAALWFDPATARGAKIALGLLSSSILALSVSAAAYIGVEDLKASHEAPALTKYQSQWRGTPSTYSTLAGNSVTVTPYLMEDFLYEKPFVTLRVTNANDRLEETDAGYSKDNYDSLGLQDKNKLSLAAVSPSITTATKLEFKSTSDWEKVGI